ncbi:Mpo1 family 2-hydroxy fatty acid dioxygenase [Noviherbaspirillum galbum]|uniref:DUF962 domain-containing protein n=1 Tax=Noviherbaspirillum galbum TaxID=2709383 RepID=A0A6B3SL35_9BURK|nr:Mpo1-like protein [Noviherbaspirillum galbum]NEX61208.1 DUF962 domain-containing protein [Noviherbaspirillum galbum]
MEHATQRQIDTLIGIYAESHRNHANEIIHFICIPLIVFSFLGMLWALHPLAAVAVSVASLIYYCMLSLPFAAGMLAMSGAMLWLLSALPQQQILAVSIGVFIVAWIGQFIGHKIEGKKPSFFDDLRFLLIGPLFCLSFLYRRLGIAY